MLNDQTQNVLDQQQAIVRRYASQLRAAACGRAGAAEGASAPPAPIKCYTLVNQCALELFEAGRERATEPGPGEPTIVRN
jgi:hypothetical protein